jgi:nitrate reductase NapE component
MDQEAEWHAEFERLGELLVYDNVKQGAIYNDEAKRQAAFRWLGEQAQARKRSETETLCTVKLTLWAAIAAVLVGILGVVVTWFHK